MKSFFDTETYHKVLRSIAIGNLIKSLLIKLAEPKTTIHRGYKITKAHNLSHIESDVYKITKAHRAQDYNS